MLNVLKTLLKGTAARAEERLTDEFAVDLIEQKIREAEQALSAAKSTLAALIIRRRGEQKVLENIGGRLKDLEGRARSALAAGREDLAATAAAAIADLENERGLRQTTLAGLDQRVERIQAGVDKAHRRIIDLRQGMTLAHAADAERRAQRTLNRTIGNPNAIREAEALIARVVDGPDLFAEAEVLDQIDDNLTHASIRDRLAGAGFGDRTRTSADDVLARLRAAPAA
jgi:phage shock protein A